MAMRLAHECARHWRRSGGVRAHSTFARSLRRKISPPRFYRGRNRIFDVDEISGASSGCAICWKESGRQSVWHWNRQSDGLAQYRHSQEKKRRTVLDFLRIRARAGHEAGHNVSADYLEPHRSSRDGLRRARNDVTWFDPRIKRTPSPDFSRQGAVIFSNSGCYFFPQLLLQYSLPLRQLSFGVVAAVAVPIKAARLTINRRYFIQFSCLSFL